MTPLRRWNLSMVVLATACLLAERFCGHLPGMDCGILDWGMWVPIVGLAVGIAGQVWQDRRP